MGIGSVVSDRVAFMRLNPRHIKALVIGGILLLLIASGAAVQWDFTALVESVKQRPIASAVVYVFALAASIVLMPLSSLMLLPFAASVWGVFIGGTLSALGWWIGALLAFSLVRHLGRPALQWIISLEKLDEWEKKIPHNITFLGIVLIRMIFPVDLPSFALGLLKNLSFKTYALASLIGIIPFAYVMVAMGGAMATGEWLLFAVLMSIVTVSVFLLYRFWRRRNP